MPTCSLSSCFRVILLILGYEDPRVRQRRPSVNKWKWANRAVSSCKAERCHWFESHSEFIQSNFPFYSHILLSDWSITTSRDRYVTFSSEIAHTLVHML